VRAASFFLGGAAGDWVPIASALPSWSHAVLAPQDFTPGCMTELKNRPYGDGRRLGAARQRSQFRLPNGHWAKRGPDGRIMDVKSDGKPFKGVSREQ
jgi:hypothetical protein